MSGDVEVVDVVAVKAEERKRIADFLHTALTSGQSIDIDKLADAVANDALTLEAVVSTVPPPPPTSTVSDVATLLRDSWAAHALAKSLRQQRVGPGSRRQYVERAYALRQQAHVLDPEHLDVSWAVEAAMTATGVNTHEAVMIFYRQQLGMS
jgi:hypothetical protein